MRYRGRLLSCVWLKYVPISYRCRTNDWERGVIVELRRRGRRAVAVGSAGLARGALGERRVLDAVAVAVSVLVCGAGYHEGRGVVRVGVRFGRFGLGGLLDADVAPSADVAVLAVVVLVAFHAHPARIADEIVLAVRVVRALDRPGRGPRVREGGATDCDDVAPRRHLVEVACERADRLRAQTRPQLLRGLVRKRVVVRSEHVVGDHPVEELAVPSEGALGRHPSDLGLRLLLRLGHRGVQGRGVLVGPVPAGVRIVETLERGAGGVLGCRGGSEGQDTADDREDADQLRETGAVRHLRFSLQGVFEPITGVRSPGPVEVRRCRCLRNARNRSTVRKGKSETWKIVIRIFRFLLSTSRLLN